MALTRHQVLVLGLLALAGEAQAAAALPGATIAQQAAHAAPGKAGRTGPPKKVATAKGSAFYRAPIGSWIIPHQHAGPGTHFVKGEPSHWAHNISQAKWVANEWKAGPRHADHAAHQAVDAGTHRWVQAGEHEFAVHKDIGVHVPAATDVHNPAAVKAAPKVFVKKDQHGNPGQHVYFHPDHPETSEALATTDAAQDLLDKHWKKLPEAPPQKSVSFAGKHAAWVPHDWKVYKSASTPEHQLAGKFARDPQGAWHSVAKDGSVDSHFANHKEPESWLKEGAIVPDDGQADQHAPLPVAGEHHPGQLKAEVPAKDGPPLAVTKDEIQHALKILQDDKSTAVKQPLAKQGHPLAAMDYHALAAQELAKHPELKTSPGSKKEHVGQVKLAVIHYLAGRAAHLSHTQAETAALEAAQDKVQAAAEHARLLTPHTVTLPAEGKEPPSGQVPVYVGGQKVKDVPAGSRVFVWHMQAADKAAAAKYVKFPDGTWHYYDGSGKYEDQSDTGQGVLDKDLASGNLVPAAEPEAAAAPGLEVGGVTVTKDQVQDAIDALQAAKSTAIKQVLKAKGSPLAETDYWAVVHAYEAAHPNTAPKAHGTKQQHAPNAKQTFIAALAEKAGQLGKADAATGHDQAAELYDLAKNGTWKPGWTNTLPGTLAKAAKKAVILNHNYYLEPFADHRSWWLSVVKPDYGSSYYKVTPQLTVVHVDAQEGESSAGSLLWNAVHQWLEPGPAGTPAAGAAQDKAPEPPAAPPGPSAAAAQPDGQGQWKKDPQWQEIHDKVAAVQPSQLYDSAAASTVTQHIARLLLFSSALNTTQYLFKDAGGGFWKASPHKPPEGSYAAPSAAGMFYEVTPDHQVVLHNSTGSLYPKTHLSVLLYLQEGVKPSEPEPVPEPPAPAPEPPAPAPEPPAPAPQGVPAILNGVYAGEFPPGSQVYRKTSGAYQGIFARDPSGQWWRVSTYGGQLKVEQAPSYAVSDAYLPGGQLEPQQPTPEQAAHAKQVAGALQVLGTGAVPDSTATSETAGKTFPAWQQAAVHALASKKAAAGDIVLIPAEGGGWKDGWITTATQEYYKIGGSTLQVTYHPPGAVAHAEPSPGLQDSLLQAVKAGVVPDSVSVDGKVVGAGYWKNPKGKAYLHVAPKAPSDSTGSFYSDGPKGWAVYTYFSASGDVKKITPAAAAKQLEKATQFSAVPFPLADDQPPDHAAYASVLAPGSYQLWSQTGKAPLAAGTLDVQPDGSALWMPGDGAAPSAFPSPAVKALLHSGTVLDKYGTSVVQSGTVPSGYHIWGSEAKTKAEIQELLDKLAASPQLQFAKEVMPFLVGGDTAKWSGAVGPSGKQLMADHAADTGNKQKAVFTGLLHELLAVPGLPEGTEVKTGTATAATGTENSAGPVFLKTMPEGITQAKDLFAFTAAGYAVPKGAVPEYAGAGKPQLVQYVKDISQQYGGGKVVGTHLSSLTGEQLKDWLSAWKSGDMKTVFALDAKGGKVSPVHPGAPDNAATHKLTWSPLDLHQVPASQDIPGPWSDLAQVSPLPAAEVDNYLIKMGFQHAEYLLAYEKQGLVRAHRQHNQVSVDAVTAKAAERSAQGLPPKTEPPVWTDGLTPAHPYDSFLAGSIPADEWTDTAAAAFYTDNQAALAPYLQQIADGEGISLSYVTGYLFYKKQAIQNWLDSEHAQAVAAQMVPVWKKIPTGSLPSHGHEVWKATSTVPYTGEVTTWFVKPPPGGEMFRLEQEHAANALGRLLGFQSAESQILTDPALGSSPVMAQKAIPGQPLGHYTDMPPWSSFTPQQTADIAAEHLLDWVLANDDTSANNMIQRPDGHLAGIDKGRCLAAGTKVSLLDGTEVPVEELAERSEPFWVYSLDTAAMRVVPGRCTRAWQTDVRDDMVEVEIDNGEVIRCTVDHKFMLRAGTWAEAGSLTAGMSLMPLYRRRVVNDKRQDRRSYEQVLHPGRSKSRWRHTHLTVYEALHGTGAVGTCVHHKDLGVTDNSPSNLQRMTTAEHQELHARLAWKEAGFSGWREYRKTLNHKVVSVRQAEAVPVYDLEVEQHHNFALTAGVFVHNSWGNMDWQGLAGTGAMDSMTKLVYTKLYDGIRSHQVTKDAADQAFLKVIQQARKMQAVSDASVAKLLEAGFAHRTKFGTLGSRKALIAEVLRRKNSLEADFTKMWAKVYQDAGYAGASPDFGHGKPWGGAPQHNPRFGTVVFNDKGQVLLREVKGHFGGTAWSFSKGGADGNETPLEAALRESAEELGAKYQPVGYVPGAFTGSQSTSYYYLAKAEGAVAAPELDNGETEQVRWVTPEEAKALIAQSESKTVSARDLAVLDAAHQAWQALPPDKPALMQDPAGTGLPAVPVQHLPDAHGAPLHSGFSEPGLAGHVAAAKSHGVPAFFGGPELRDMHVLVWQQNDSAGAKSTHGETFLAGSAYGKVVSWLKSHSGTEAASADDTAVSYPGGSYGPGTAPAGSPDRGGVTGERDHYNAIIAAARTVTNHKLDGQYNQARLDAMAETQHKLEGLKQGAEAVIAGGQDPGSPGVKLMQNLHDMTVLYLDHIARVLAAKDGAYGFSEGDLPRWLPKADVKPEATDELSALGIKLHFGNYAAHDQGRLDDAGEFSPESGMHHDPGKWWRMTLPDGEQVVFGNGKDTGVQVAHWGRVRFSTKDGSAASLERIRAAMQLTGLEMREAEVPDFELFYWRHLLATMNDRKGGSQQPVWAVLRDRLGPAWPLGGTNPGRNDHRKVIAALEALGKTDPAAEVTAYREAFAALTSAAHVQSWADRGGFLPVQKHFDPNSPGTVSGKPDWYRFDLAAEVKNLPMPSRSGDPATALVKAGGTYGKDALMRVAGIAANGMSNPYSSGGTAYVFTRLNQTSHRSVVLSPLVLARTHNYSYSDDFFGNHVPPSEGGYQSETRRENAPWDSSVWSSYSGSSNETMVSDALSLLDDVELLKADSASHRAGLVKWLKDRGIIEIRHMPVEDRIVTEINSAAVAKVKANHAAHPELLDPLAAQPEPGYSGASETEAAQAEKGPPF